MEEFDPLDYQTIADTVVSALLKKPVEPLLIQKSFPGAGVYLIYYRGPFAAYKPISKTNTPVYVGKAIPPGSRRGPAALRQIEQTKAPMLHNRLGDHSWSIEAAENLDISDFRCRYLVVTPIWIAIAESLVIEKFNPVWNAVVDGFGLHDPGTTRYTQKRSDWDTIHAARLWGPKIQDGKSVAEMREAIRKQFEG